MHIPDREKCNWLRDQIETQLPGKYGPSRKAVILDRLMWATDFENFLSQKWTAAKRFGLEGCETLIPGMFRFIDFLWFWECFGKGFWVHSSSARVEVVFRRLSS